jgi:DNA-binding MarR family transcriptional regulator
VTVVSEAYYHGCMPAAASTIDVAALASRVRLGVTRLARKLRREGDPGVTPTLLAALSTIERHGPMTAGGLASHEQVEKPTVTRLLAVLDERDLIERTPDPLDGRVAWVQVSSAGRKLLQRTRRRKDEYLVKRIKGLSPRDQATLEDAAEILDRLTEGDR